MKSKITLLLLCTAMMYSFAFAQSKILLQRVAGGSADDAFSCLNLTKDGGTIAGGTSYSGISGNKTEASRGSADYWIVKYDKAGAIQWDKTIGSSGYDELACVQQTTDGGYIVGGTSSGGVSGDKTGPRIGYNDYWIVKLDKDGTILWDKTIGEDQSDYYDYYAFSLKSLQQTSDKGYILAGINNNDNDGYFDPYWVVKLDSSGNMQWSNYYYQALAYDVSYPPTVVVQQTPDSGYILGGSTLNRYYDALFYQAIKLDNTGKVIWSKEYPDGEYGNLTALVQTGNSYILGGSTEANKYGSYGTTDYLLLRIDTAGNEINYKYLGGNGNDFLTSLERTSDGGLLVGGYSNSDSSDDKTENSKGGYDYWIVKLDAADKVMWNKTYGGSGDDELYTVKERKPGEYVLGGSSSSGYSGNKRVASMGGVDYWGIVMQYAAPALKPLIAAVPDFSVYPNPATTTVHIYTKGKAEFALFNQFGKSIASKVIDNNGTIDVSAAIPGIYFITNLSTGKKQSIIIAR